MFPVASKPKTTRGFLPPPCCPQTQRRRVSPLRCIKNLHRRTEGFPSPLHQSQRRRGGFLPPPCCPQTQQRRVSPLHCIKNLHRQTEGFPSPLRQSQRRQRGFLPPTVFPTDERRGKPLRRVKAHINMAGRISPPHQVAQIQRTRVSPSLLQQKPTYTNRKVSLPVASVRIRPARMSYRYRHKRSRLSTSCEGRAMDVGVKDWSNSIGIRPIDDQHLYTR